jgi:2-polyprenyl-6-methoxyphenol hydroxylase-like FAD-dependent oxidoreductase
MWQLTFRMPEDEAQALSKGPRKELLGKLLAQVKGWHEPVAAMMTATDCEGVFFAPLYDRDPPPTNEKRRTGAGSRVTMLGDAAHPMSPFKGQGANSALGDAAHLAKWFQKAPPATAIACYEREMVARSAPRVLASRAGATELHCPSVLGKQGDIAGVVSARSGELLATLKSEGIGAAAGSALDDQIRDVLNQLAVAHDEPPREFLRPELDGR